MPEETLYCPSCNQKVRVPEEMLGQPVQCPLCRLVFTAPMRGGAALPPTVNLAPTGYPGPYPESRTSLVAPGIALLVVGILGLMLHLLRLAQIVLTGSQAIAAQYQQTQEEIQRMMPGVENPGAQLGPQTVYLLFVGMASLFVVADLLVALGGLQMIRGRRYGLALTGSLIAMLNCGCCFLGFPFGLWALIALLRPDVRNTFG